MVDGARRLELGHTLTYAHSDLDASQLAQSAYNKGKVNVCTSSR